MPIEKTMWACGICGRVYGSESQAKICEDRGTYTGFRAIVPSELEFNPKLAMVMVGRKYLAARISGLGAVVPVTITGSYQSGYNQHETYYSAVKDNGVPLDLNGWSLIEIQQ